MRLLILVQNHPPERGPVRYTSTLAQGLAARGHEVRVITGLPHYPEGVPHDGYGAWLPSLRHKNGVEVQRVPLMMASNRQLARRVVGMATFAGAALPFALSGPRPDIVIASAPPLPIVALGAAVAKSFRSPLALLLRDVEPQITLDMRGLSHHWWAKAAIRSSADLYDRGDRLVVVHESQVATLTDHGIAPEKVETIRHGIDIDRFLEQAQTGPTLPGRPGRLQLLYVGTMGVAHDVDRLVALFDTDEVRALPVDLALVGSGERRDAVHTLIRQRHLENVRLMDPAPLDDVPSLLLQADALVTSYRTEGKNIPGMIGSKLYEYCAAAKPIIVHGRGVAADLVTSVGNGWAVTAGDASGLAQTLRQLVDAPDAARAMGARGREYARQHFSLKARDNRWEQLLLELHRSTAAQREPAQRIYSVAGT